MNWEIIFHGGELLVLIFGVAAPIIISVLKLRTLLGEYPLHRHVNSHILYPKGYEPPDTE